MSFSEHCRSLFNMIHASARKQSRFESDLDKIWLSWASHSDQLWTALHSNVYLLILHCAWRSSSWHRWGGFSMMYALLLHCWDIAKVDRTAHIWDTLGWDDPIMHRNTSQGILWSLIHQALVYPQSRWECPNTGNILSWVASEPDISCNWVLNNG